MFRLRNYPAQGNCREATLCNYPQWAADGSSEREAFHLTAGSALDKSFAETLQTVINDNNQGKKLSFSQKQTNKKDQTNHESQVFP